MLAEKIKLFKKLFQNILFEIELKISIQLLKYM